MKKEKTVAICQECGKLLPIFGHGLCDKCYHHKYYLENKERLNKKNKQYYEDNKEAITKINKEYQKNHKQEIKERNKKWREKNKDTLKIKKHEYYEKNKEEISLKNKLYRETHKEAKRVYDQKWRQSESGKISSQKHKKTRRAAEAQIPYIENVDLQVLYERYDGICQCCQKKCNWDDYYYTIGVNGIRAFVAGPTYPTHDHIIPVSVEGSEESYANAQLLCKSCNASKSNKIIE